MTVGIDPERWREIERLYQLVQEREPGEREAFLRDACAGDDDLRMEVAALLADQSRIDRFIESPAMNVAAQALAQEQAQATLKPGQTVAHYRVVEEIGHGGMGVVYRAEDTKLKRTVALKFLPPAFAADPERLIRFEREARLVASLNHPNIAAIYGLEEAAGKRFLVLELVEGETLAQRIARGPLPVDEALKVCRQIAEGLEYAHERGIIHRDLKPANVKLTAEGQVKVLDFGLAKAQESAAGSAEDSPTLTVSPTRAGVILGTAAYMSPEQASGKPVDKRADIWSFGVVLWELLTGHRLFEGETVSHTLAEVLRGPIEFDQLPPETPAAIRGLLRRCLNRDVKNRLRDIGEARIAIEASLAGETPLLESVPGPGGARRLRLAWSVAAVLAVSLALVAFLHLREKPPAEAAAIRLTISPPEKATYFSQTAVSPDGSRIVWASNRGGTYQLYQKPASGVGQDELLFKSDDELLPNDWSDDGRFILYQRKALKTQYELWALPLEGDRKPFPFLQTPFNDRLGFFSPDGRWIAYISDESGKSEVCVQTFPASAVRWQVSTKGGLIPTWRGDGKEMFYLSADKKLMAVDVKTGSTFEAGIPKVLFDLSEARIVSGAGYAVTADGQRFIFVRQMEQTAPPSLAVVVNWTADLKK
jgi:serine/threonine protein kinase